MSTAPEDPSAEERWTIIAEHNRSLLGPGLAAIVGSEAIESNDLLDELELEGGVDLGDDPPWHPDPAHPGYSVNQGSGEPTIDGNTPRAHNRAKRAEEIDDKCKWLELPEERGTSNDE